jgi:hypothetical protein
MRAQRSYVSRRCGRARSTQPCQQKAFPCGFMRDSAFGRDRCLHIEPIGELLPVDFIRLTAADLSSKKEQTHRYQKPSRGRQPE